MPFRYTRGTPTARDMEPALYIDTARRLRPRQIAGRARRLIPPALLATGTDRGAAAELRPVARGLTVSAAPQAGPTAPPHDVGAFSAFGAVRRWGAAGFWNDDRDELLYVFHLHGFEALSRYAAEADGRRSRAGDAFWRAVVEEWLIRHARPTMPAWHPFPTSIRLVALTAAAPALDWPDGLRRAVAAAVRRQARYLGRCVEHDIGGNHVLKNAAALAVAGVAVGEEPLVRRGCRLLRAELARQLLPDGGHEERSTSYHREVLHDLDTVQLVLERDRRREPEWLGAARTSARKWMSDLAGPDGRLPLLNDAWEGPSVTGRRPDALTQLRPSGYVVLRNGSDQLVFDAGAISPPHLPPHAHADALSFVLWLDGRPLLIDPGSHLYTGPTRNRFRGTRAHNTVEVAGADQCRFWGDFRLAYPPAVRMYEPRRVGTAWVLGGEHDGYHRLPSPVRHVRCVVWWPRRGVVVVDRLAGAGEHDVVSSLHLAPGTETAGPARAGPAVVEALGGGRPRIDRGEYAPYLGVRRSIDVIRDARRVPADTPFGWSLLRPGARVLHLSRDRIELAAEDGERVAVTLPYGGA